MINNLGVWSSWVVVEDSYERCSSESLSKISRIGTSSLQQSTKTSVRSNVHRTFSPMRLIMWFSLLVGARGQLTEQFPSQFELSSLDGTNGFIINGEAAYDSMGSSVSTAGDVNGDGLSDILVGASNAASSGRGAAGKSYVVFGSRIVVIGGTFELSSLDGTNGFILNGEAISDKSGSSVSSAGDVNGDGLSDIVIGAPGASGGRSVAGMSYLVFGNRSLISGNSLDLSSLNGNNGFSLSGEADKDESGTTVSSAGDVNGDGFADFIIGAYRTTRSVYFPVRSYVVYGSPRLFSGGTSNLSILNGTNGFILNGESAGDKIGISVSSAGDMNGDGLSDLVIGVPSADPPGRSDAGKTYVVFGSRNVASNGIFELSNLDGTNGFILNGESYGDSSGISVSSAGDVNGDGLSDLAIGAYKAGPSSRFFAGKSYVVFGRSAIVNGGTFELSSLNGTNGFIINGEASYDQSGRSVASVGDINGDGISDLVIGASEAKPLGRSKAGKSYVVFGSRTIVSGGILDLSSLNGTNGFIINGEATDDLSGISVSSAGDVNGDGLSDLLIGAYGAASSGKTWAGKSYVIFGRNLSMNTQTLPPSRGATSSLPTIAATTLPLSSGTKETSSQIIYNPTSVPNTQLSQLSTNPSVLPENSSKPSTPFIAGIATLVAAIACSLFGGALFYFQKRKQTSNNEPEKCMNEQREAPIENLYDDLPIGKPSSHYNDWPQGPQPQTTDHYDQRGLDQMNREMDQYQDAKVAKRHEGYDDIQDV